MFSSVRGYAFHSPPSSHKYSTIFELEFGYYLVRLGFLRMLLVTQRDVTLIAAETSNLNG